MNKPNSEQENTVNSTRNPPRKPKKSFLLKLTCSEKLSACSVALFFVILILLPIWFLQTFPASAWDIVYKWSTFHESGVQETKADATKLREAVTFLPLKDLSYKNTPMQGHTWFMSSLYDTYEDGEVQYQRFPTESSNGRLLCLKGRDPHNGSLNSYALAWPEALPQNATLMNGITFVSYNHYDYGNIWHGLSSMMPFVRWHIKNQCVVPQRWILYYWGEVKTSMAPWVETMMQATFGGGPLDIEKFDKIYHDELGGDEAPTCFQEAVVMRHYERGMSRKKRMEVYDLMRCKSRMFCNVTSRSDDMGLDIGMTMLMRDGGRSYKNASAVIRIFDKECRNVEGCRLMVEYPNNLTFCEQVKLMSLTDIVISAHGAQLSNMILMDRNSSVLELFPKGWLKLAGIGQYVFHTLASSSGMKHQGVWRDPIGEPCPFPETDNRCMSVFKNGKIGYNETYFSEWAKNVLNEVKLRKVNGGVVKNHVSGLCSCD